MASVTLYHYLAVFDTDGTRLGDTTATEWLRDHVVMKYGRSSANNSIDMTTANWVSQAMAFSKYNSSWTTGTTYWSVGGDLPGYDFVGWAKGTSAAIDQMVSTDNVFNYSVSTGSHNACAYYKKCAFIRYAPRGNYCNITGGVSGQEEQWESQILRIINMNHDDELLFAIKPDTGYKVTSVKVQVFNKNQYGSDSSGSAIQTQQVDWDWPNVSTPYGDMILTGNPYNASFNLKNVDETKVFAFSVQTAYDGSFEVPVG